MCMLVFPQVGVVVGLVVGLVVDVEGEEGREDPDPWSGAMQ